MNEKGMMRKKKYARERVITEKPRSMEKDDMEIPGPQQ